MQFGIRGVVTTTTALCAAILACAPGLAQIGGKAPGAANNPGSGPVTVSARTGARTFERQMLLEDAAYTSGNVSVGDIDGDGRLDVVLVKGRHWPLQNLALLGQGQGHFTLPRALGPGPDRSYTGALVDLDHDGDLDLVVSNDSPDPKRVLHNDGAGVFNEVQQFGAPDWNTRHVSVADLDNDGRADVIVANRGGADSAESYLCLGIAEGLLEDPCRVIYRGSATTITPADIDADGDLDLVVPHRDGGQSRLLLNDGSGAFPLQSKFGPPDAAYRSAATADFDGDGRMDIAIIAPGSPDNATLSDASEQKDTVPVPHAGIFYGGTSGIDDALVVLDSSAARPYAIAADDVDNDGRVDLVVGFVRSAPVVFFNEGERIFTRVTFGDAEGAAYGFAIVDLNADGLKDIVMARSGAPNAVFFAGAGTEDTPQARR